MKIHKSQLKWNVPQYGIRYMVSWELGDMKSSIIKRVISVIQIEPKLQGDVSQKKKHDDIQMPKNTGLIGWLERGSTEGSW